MTARKTPQATDETPDVERHDEVYFRHAAGPKSGKVLARGRDGCTVESDGKHHKVRWEHMLGHKTKVRPDARVVDQGDDGLIVESQGGQRRFVRDPLGPAPDAAEKAMAKALPVALFLRPV